MTTGGGSAGTAAAGFRADPPTVPRPRHGDDPTEPGRRANTGRHRAPAAPPRLSRRQVAGIAAGGVAALAVTIGLAAAYAPDPTPPRAATLPAYVEQPREPSGHGGPLAPPSIAADLPVWEPDDGPVIVAGQALPRPAPITRSATPPEPEPVELAGLPPIPPATASPEPQPEPEPVGEPMPALPFPVDDIDDVVIPDPEPEPTDPQPEPAPADPQPPTDPAPDPEPQP